MSTDDSFATAVSLQRRAVDNYRRIAADRLTAIADEYAFQALRSEDVSEQRWLEAVSEGLRIAAKEVEPSG